MVEEKSPQLFHATLSTLPVKFPLGLFPKSLQPYLELMRVDKVYFVNILYIMQQSFILNLAQWYNSYVLAIR